MTKRAKLFDEKDRRCQYSVISSDLSTLAVVKVGVKQLDRGTQPFPHRHRCGNHPQIASNHKINISRNFFTS